ncbi:hypothetical protein CANCADRAFT_2923 [Tortispora caseinolytica NRRL Y-17796]|uniref:F-box domain-containing protein n=1 Tax=Tortispora caseinolytica NRRL Y-17796 TaxID=767744 RepID=A0A1E4THM1_9ASCO|nr:hypothetical protein CANCADRAFT_2923 [Tortispora caseinolytica NRRL Y-17796]
MQDSRSSKQKIIVSMKISEAESQYKKKNYHRAIEAYNLAKTTCRNSEQLTKIDIGLIKSHWKQKDYSQAILRLSRIHSKWNSELSYIYIDSLVALNRTSDAVTYLSRNPALLNGSQYGAKFKLFYDKFGLSIVDPLAKLPAEVAGLIFNLLDKQSLYSCRLVSLRWRNLVDRTSSLWTRMSYKFDNSRSKNKCNLSYLYSAKLKHLEFTSDSKDTKTYNFMLAKFLEDLNVDSRQILSLDLQSQVSFFIASDNSSFYLFPNLVSFSGSLAMYDMLMLASRNSNIALEKLHLKLMVTMFDMQTLSQFHPNTFQSLRRLILHYPDYNELLLFDIKDCTVDMQVLDKFPYLEFLEMKNFYMTSKSKIVLPKLSVLSLHGCSTFTDCEFPKLNTLIMSSCGLSMMSETYWNVSAPNLVFLSLQRCDMILTQSFPKVKAVRFILDGDENPIYYDTILKQCMRSPNFKDLLMTDSRLLQHNFYALRDLNLECFIISYFDLPELYLKPFISMASMKFLHIHSDSVSYHTQMLMQEKFHHNKSKYMALFSEENWTKLLYADTPLKTYALYPQ